MSTKTRTHAPTRSHSHGGRWLVAVVLAVVAGVALMGVLGRPDTGGLVATGATNAMGMPVVATPGEATGEATAGGVAVAGANWSLGTVPLDVSVQPTWTLRNTGDRTVALGEPHPEVRAGCCPGALTVSDPELAPGEEAVVTFDLAMHQGMDGWHDIAVHVPAGEEVLTLGVTGDFRG